MRSGQVKSSQVNSIVSFGEMLDGVSCCMDGATACTCTRIKDNEGRSLKRMNQSERPRVEAIYPAIQQARPKDDLS